MKMTLSRNSIRRSIGTLVLVLSLLIPRVGFGLGVDYLNRIAETTLSTRLSEEELSKWDTGDDTMAIKTAFVESLLKSPPFVDQVILRMRFQLLKGATHDDIYHQIEEFDVLSLMLPLSMDDEEELAMYTMEKSKLLDVFSLREEYLAGEVSLEDFYKRFFDNFIYDKQNMGILNYVNSTFQYTMGRAPTEMEYRQASTMLLDHTAYLFYKEGSSKADYLDIITSNDNFLEYQVKYWYHMFLMKFPDNRVVHEILMILKDSLEDVDIDSIIKHILIHEVGRCDC